ASSLPKSLGRGPVGIVSAIFRRIRPAAPPPAPADLGGLLVVVGRCVGVLAMWTYVVENASDEGSISLEQDFNRSLHCLASSRVCHRDQNGGVDPDREGSAVCGRQERWTVHEQKVASLE